MSSSESDSSQDEGDGAEEEDNAKEGKGGIKTSSDEQEASDGEDRQEHSHTQDTLTGVRQLFSKHEDTDPESDPGEKVQSAWQKQCQDSPKEYSPQKDSSGSPSMHNTTQHAHVTIKHSKRFQCKSYRVQKLNVLGLG